MPIARDASANARISRPFIKPIAGIYLDIIFGEFSAPFSPHSISQLAAVHSPIALMVCGTSRLLVEFEGLVRPKRDDFLGQ